MKKVIVILLAIIVLFLGYVVYNNYLPNRMMSDPAPQNQEYIGWENVAWGNVSFQYPPNWTIETVTTKTGSRLLINGPSSENQVIAVATVGSMNLSTEVYNLKTIKDVVFAIPRGLSEESQQIFLKVVASAK